MKRWTALLLSSLLLVTLCACSTKEAPAATAAPTAEPVAEIKPTQEPESTPEPEPSTEPAVVLADAVGAVYTLLHENDSLNVTGEEGECYTVELEGQTLLVEKRFVALPGQEPFQSRTGYARFNTRIFDNVYLDGEALQTLSENTNLTVTAKLGECLRLKLADGSVCYAATDSISDYFIQHNAPTGGADGGDIPLALRQQPGRVVFLADLSVSYPTTGTVLCDGVEAYLRIFSRGDEVKVSSHDEESAELYLDGQCATVPTRLLRLAGQSEYAAWDGYAQFGSRFYQGYRLLGAGTELAMNTKLCVLADFGNCYWVEWENGKGFLPHDAVSDAPANPIPAGNGGGQWTTPVL